MTLIDTSTLNDKHIPSELKSRATTDAVAPEPASSAALSDWDAHSIAVVAQVTAPLRSRDSSRHAVLD